jgi:multidrug resistance efflux pump
MVQKILIFLILAAALFGALWASQRRAEPLKVSGFIEADEIRVGSRVGGRVKAVHVDEGQKVRRGDLLVELEPFDLLQRLAEAQAQRARAQATLERLNNGFRAEEIAQAKAHVDQLAANLEKLEYGPRKQEIDAAAHELALSQFELELAANRQKRAERLLGGDAVSRDEYEAAQTNLRVAQARVQVNQDSLALLKEGTRAEDIAAAKAQLDEAQQAYDLKRAGYRAEEIAEAKASFDAANAAEQVIQQQIDELKIVAPVDGAIEAVELQPGDLVLSNAPVISIMDTARLWVRAYVPENRLNIQIDQRVPISVDSFPNDRFRGRITFIARQAEFTPGNVQTPEERSKQVFRIKVTLLDGLDRLRPGMSADVWLDEATSDE